jgi:hypothetical protein
LTSSSPAHTLKSKPSTKHKADGVNRRPYSYKPDSAFMRHRLRRS